ncbi:MAG: hypothetical protein KBT08_04210 [Bacteroidales bacterium]|nr:hypothetical protein [Candidatus Cryptobacteroides onthequi]
MKKTFIYTAAIASMVLALASCEKEPSQTLSPKGAMSLSVVANDIATKAQASASNIVYGETIDLSTDEFNLFLSATEEDNNTNAIINEPLTKGTIITTENFEAQRSSDFNVRLTNAGTTSLYKENVKAVTSGQNNVWEIKQGDEYVFWPEENGAIDFWCWSGNNASNYTVVPASGDLPIAMTFNYEDKSATASEQSDLIFAHSGNQTESANANGNVGIHFYHALAAVQFCVGNLDEGVTVKNITIKGVKNSGTCAYVPEGFCVDENGNRIITTSSTADHYSGDVSDLFVWYVDDESTTNFTTGGLSSKNTNASEFGTEFGGDAVSTFFFVPQQIMDLTFEMTITNGTTERVVKHTFAGKVGLDIISSWKAGKIYRYTISGTGVSVKVDETVTGSVDAITAKSAVKGENNGAKTAYIRAAVVANWYNDKGQIVAPLDASKMPTMSKNKWFSAEEGSETGCNVLFYYYQDPVDPSQKTSTALIESYTKENAGAAPKAGAHLEMNIIMQAVEAEADKASVKAAWGETIANQLTTKTN